MHVNGDDALQFDSAMLANPSAGGAVSVLMPKVESNNVSDVQRCNTMLFLAGSNPWSHVMLQYDFLFYSFVTLCIISLSRIGPLQNKTSWLLRGCTKYELMTHAVHPQPT